jgi:hypothetical protein
VNQTITIRDAKEIQAAHDKFVAILLNEVPNPFLDEQLDLLKAAVGVLCWVLHHDHHKAFEKTLAEIDAFFREQGIVWEDTGQLHNRAHRAKD